MRRAVVTGASGFIGSQLASAFTKSGFRVLGLCRNPLPNRVNASIDFAPFRLGNRFEYDGDVLIHCAYDKAPPYSQFNVRSSEALFRDARERGFSRIVYISSIAARPDACSRYGREKYEIENTLDWDRDLAIRPGLVIGSGGLFASIVGTIKRFGVAPIFEGGRQPVYTVAIDNLVDAIVRLERSAHSGIVTVAAPVPVSMRDLYVTIGHHYSRRVTLVPMPYAPTLALARACERLGIALPITSENLRGIRNLVRVSVSPLDSIELSLDSFEDALGAMPR